MKEKSSHIKYLITQEIHKLEELEEKINEQVNYSLFLNIQVWAKLFSMIRDSISKNSLYDCEEIMIIKNNLHDIYSEMGSYFNEELFEVETKVLFSECVQICKELRDLI